MIKINYKGIVLEKRWGIDFEANGVLNPGCILVDGVTYMFYRAVNKENVSSIGCCHLKKGKVIFQSIGPVIFPEFEYEKRGVEDPRITFLDDKYYLLYTAYDGKNATVAMATSTDLVHFRKEGVIIPKISYDEAEDIFRLKTKLNPRYNFFEKVYRSINGDNVLLWEKDVVLFPQRINGQIAMLHRILPGIQLITFDQWENLNIDYWKKYLAELDKHIVLDPVGGFESAYVGAGCVPIETELGWLLIYHSVEIKNNNKIYRASIALLDKKDPRKVLKRLPYPLFEPKKSWEKEGMVDNVVFPTGAVVENDILYIYYGAADLRIGLVTMSLSELLKLLINEG
ncbi:MAG TPA: pesticidal protein Cry7Aa [Candidatus Woesebacteria bacterium]|nr:pesticidal protein Cry7Aa [Candidatus Woesebacteria bacterium]